MRDSTSKRSQADNKREREEKERVSQSERGSSNRDFFIAGDESSVIHGRPLDCFLVSEVLDRREDWKDPERQQRYKEDGSDEGGKKAG